MKWILVALIFSLSGCTFRHQAKNAIVREGAGDIAARATADYPNEVTDETQASVLACQGATAQAQAALLDRVLMKKAASGKPLYQAEIPHIEVQRHVRTLVNSAQVTQTSVHNKTCTVTISIPKSELKAILREAK